MSDDKKVVKSSIWYIFSNFIVSGMHFIVTPIFARILTQEEYGLYSNYSSWLGVFQIITSLMLLVSLYTASVEYKEELNEYIISMLALSGLFTIVIWWGVNNFKESFQNITGIDSNYIHVMFLFLLTNPITNFFQLRQRLRYKYKSSIFISILISVSTLAGALLFVHIFDNKLTGRIYGSQIPNIIINIGILFILLKRTKKIQIKFWKYALPISIPYMFHSLGVNVLSSSDRIMITNICGANDNSLYSLAYSCAMVITTLVSAVSASFDPWLLSEFNNKGHKSKVVTKNMAIGMFVLCVGISIFAPEVILIVGGSKYLPAISVMPPVIMGLFFQFIYSLYATIEQFLKKTIWMAIATALAAVSNVLLNAFFLPRFGYIAAAYTTLFCYVLLFTIHYFVVKKLNYSWMFDGKTNIFLGIIGILFCLLISYIYMNAITRMCLCVIYCLFILVLVVKYRKIIKMMLQQWLER